MQGKSSLVNDFIFIFIIILIIDSSNGISSQDENSGCEEYGRSNLISKLDPPIIVPVPVGKSR